MSEKHTDALGRELPAGLAWSNTLVRLDSVSLLAAVRESFKEMLEERPDDLELQDRVRGYFEDAQAGLALEEDPEAMLEALGTLEDILPSQNT